jgi:DNA-binding NtrC family response regulator
MLLAQPSAPTTTARYTKEAAPPVLDPAGLLGLRVLGSARTLPLAGPECSVGTARGNTLVLADPYVSKRHCALRQQAGVITVHDLASRNGTWVNDVRVERCEVGLGARIVVGRTALQLVGEGPARRRFGLVGEHPSVVRLVEAIERLGPSRQPVLIQGETGTGKELVARGLHEAGPARTGPFEPLNCGAIPRELAESELFGHAEGAFTGAGRERRGAFERADGGTLFLDEVGEMPLELQPKLLRVLEEGAVQRIGEERRRPVSVRVVAATNRDLTAEAERGRFRLDLYHRIAVELLHLLPLRERLEDIPLLVRHFLELEAGAGIAVALEPRLLDGLSQQSWPGNVRELRNVVRRLLDRCCEPAPELELETLLQHAPAAPETGAVACVGRTMREIRRDVYLANLRACQGNRTAAAATLGIPKSTFFDHLRELGIEP